MRRHIRETCQIAPNRRNGDEGMQLLLEHTIRRQEDRLEAIEQRTEQMLTIVQQIAARPLTGVPDIIAHHSGSGPLVVNQRVIVIANFGQENTGHIGPDKIKALLDEMLPRGAAPILPSPQDAILKAALMIYSDPEHPENLTCYLPNKRGAEALVHGERGWEVQPVRLIAPRMAKTSIDLLFGKQPLEEDYAGIMRALMENEATYLADAGPMKTVLIRNKELLARVLEGLPVAGPARPQFVDLIGQSDG